MQLEFSSYVYFAEAVGRDLVKIGTSGNPFVRISHLSSRHGWELRLVGAVPGEFHDESRLHGLFEEFRAREHGREWYVYSGIARNIEELLARCPEGRMPRRLSKEEILLRAEIKYLPAGRDQEIASRAFGLLHCDRSLSVDQAKEIAARELHDDAARELVAKLYGPKNR